MKSLAEVNLDQLIADVRKHAAANPHNVVGCHYFAVEGVPECIVGCALHDQGYTLADLSGRNTTQFEDEVSNNVQRISVLLEREGIFDPKVAWLGCVQRQQDESNRWEQAVAIADELYPLTQA